MEIVKNKWLNIAIVITIMILTTIVAMSLLTFKQNATGKFKATLDLSSLTGGTPASTSATTTPPTTTPPATH